MRYTQLHGRANSCLAEVDSLTSGRLSANGINTPIVSFDDGVEAYRTIDERPQQSIELGVRLP